MHEIEPNTNSNGTDTTGTFGAYAEMTVAKRRGGHKMRMIEHNGQTMCLSDWARSVGISPGLLYMRLRDGWSMDRALTTPARKRRRRSVVAKPSPLEVLRDRARRLDAIDAKIANLQSERACLVEALSGK